VPSNMFMYHLYHGTEGKNLRRLVYPDWPQQSSNLNELSTNEIRFVLSGNGIVGEGRLGTERTLSEYGKFCGLDFVNGEILDNYYEF
jgi:hypothetical protein